MLDSPGQRGMPMNTKWFFLSLTLILLIKLQGSFYAPDPYPPYPGVDEEIQQGQ